MSNLRVLGVSLGGPVECFDQSWGKVAKNVSCRLFIPRSVTWGSENKEIEGFECVVNIEFENIILLCE